jgi:ABC-type sugar transport system substrate-binding protein
LRRAAVASGRALLALAAALAVLAAPQISAAEDLSCPLASEKPMLVGQLFFGLSVQGRGPVTRGEWNAFVQRDVAPRFPGGFTVYDAEGQWLDAARHAVVREKSKVMIIAVEDTVEARTNLAAVAELYRAAFRQQSVGIITRRECAAF